MTQYHIDDSSKDVEPCALIEGTCSAPRHYASAEEAREDEEYLRFGRLDLSRGPAAAITNEGIEILDPSILERIDRKELSASLVSNLLGCPARWVAESFITKELIPETDDTPSTRGRLFHRVMEHLFALDEEERTRENIPGLIELTLQEKDYRHFAKNGEALEWLRETIDKYYRMGGRPKFVKVANYRRTGEKEPSLGLEVEVYGKIGETKRNIKGYVDRLTEDRTDPSKVIIEDWKTGKEKPKWNPATKDEKGLSEARQQTIYSLLLRADGIEVSGARLIYPAAMKMVEVDIDDERIIKRAIEDVELADRLLSEAQEQNLFKFSPPEVLCAWCPLAKICPKASIKPFAKARAAVKTQPAPEVLAPAFDFR